MLELVEKGESLNRKQTRTGAAAQALEQAETGGGSATDAEAFAVAARQQPPCLLDLSRTGARWVRPSRRGRGRAGPAGAAPAVLRDRLSDGSPGPEMVVVPAGGFLMGSPPQEKGRYSDEASQSRAKSKKPFAIGNVRSDVR